MPSKWLQEKILTEMLVEKNKKIEDNNAFITDGGVSRWPSLERGLKINNICVLDSFGNVINQIAKDILKVI